MRILMISSYLPYPLLSGGQVRLFNLIKVLSVDHEITLVCEMRPTQSAQDVAAVEMYCKTVRTVARRKQWSLRNIVRSGVTAHSFLLNGHRHHAMQRAIGDELGGGSFAVIHVETFYVLQNLPPTAVPVVLVEHNIEYGVYERYRHRAPAVLRPFVAIDVAKLRREEEMAWSRADVLVAVSNADKAVMEEAGLSVRVIPNGVDTEKFGLKSIPAAISEQEKRILFIGDFRWLQNRDSVAFILEEIWPILRKRLTGHRARLWIVGRQIPQSVRRLAGDPDVMFDEASSARPTPEIFRDAYLLLAPIRVGGGTSYKILEAMSCGTPVVTMKLSADGLEARDGQDLLVGQTAEELADRARHLFDDAGAYERIGTAGRAFVEGRYRWKEIARSLDGIYSSIRKASV
jgi:glycosyltransferase involved in cell wall biosynthesis